MKLTMKPRCHRCRYPIPGNPYHGDGKEFCSKSCCEFHIIDQIVRQSRFRTVRFRSPWYIVLAVLAMMMSMAMTDKAMSHDIYTDWTIPGQNKSCCNLQDCRPTPAKFERGSWWAKHRDYWVKVPDDRIVKYKTQDTDAHLCISEHSSEVFCFRPPPMGM